MKNLIIASGRHILISLLAFGFLFQTNMGFAQSAPDCACNTGYYWSKITPSSGNFYALTKAGAFIYATANDLSTPYSIGDRKYIDYKYYDLNAVNDTNNKMFITHDGTSKYNIWICLKDGTSIANGSSEYIEYEQGLAASSETNSYKQLKKVTTSNTNPRYTFDYSNGSNNNHINHVIKIVQSDSVNAPVLIGTSDFEDVQE